MLTGMVKKSFSERGFYFIARDDGQGDAFLHARMLERSGIVGIAVGDRLEFDLAESRDGKMEAVNIRRLDGGTDSPAPRYGN